MSGRFITFEGGDGAGKTTLISRLSQELRAQGFEVVTTREPGGSSIGKEIRELLLSHHQDKTVSPLTEVMLFLADRIQHIEEVIKPAVEAGKIVLCDRFNDSTVVYQGVGRGLGFEKIRDLCAHVCGGFSPDLTLFLDLEPRVGLKRAMGIKEQDRFESEKIEFHNKVRQGFQQIAQDEPGRFHILDASQDADSVFREALSLLQKKLFVK